MLSRGQHAAAAGFSLGCDSWAPHFLPTRPLSLGLLIHCARLHTQRVVQVFLHTLCPKLKARPNMHKLQCIWVHTCAWNRCRTSPTSIFCQAIASHQSVHTPASPTALHTNQHEVHQTTNCRDQPHAAEWSEVVDGKFHQITDLVLAAPESLRAAPPKHAPDTP